MDKPRRAVLDTTYLLPFFGIRVPGLEPETVLGLRDELGVEELLYPMLLIPELVAKIGKEMRARGLDEIPAEALEALTALLLEVDVALVPPKLEHLVTAVKLRALGHPDIFDNILYAVSLHEKAYLVTRDTTFIRFLEEKGLPVDHVVLR